MVLGFGTSVLICTALVYARASSTQAQGTNETNPSRRPAQSAAISCVYDADPRAPAAGWSLWYTGVSKRFRASGPSEDRTKPSLIQRVQNFLSLCLNAKTALTAEDVRAQEFIAEFSVRVVLLAQLDKVGQFLINRVQFRRRHCK